MATLALPPVQAPQIVDPIQEYSHAANLGAMLQERQLRQQQIQKEQIANQQQQIKLQDQQKLTDLFKNNKGNIAKTIEGAADAGVSPESVNILNDQYQQSLTRQATVTKQENENQLALGNKLAGRIDAVKMIKDPIARAAAWGDQRRQAVAAGELKQDDPMVPADYPGDDHLDGIESTLLGHNGFMETVLKHQQAATSAAEQQNREVERPGLQAKSDDEIRASVASKLSAADNSADYTRLYDKLPDDQKAMFPDPKTWTPDTPKKVNRIGMTSAQRSQADYQASETQQRQRTEDIAAKRADIADRMAGIAQQRADALDKRLDIMARNSGKFETTEVDKAISNHDKLQQQEADKWKQVQEYWDAAGSKESEVVDPKTGKTVDNDQAHRDYFKAQAEQITKQAQTFQDQAKQVRQRFKFGEFGPDQGQQPATPPAATPKPAAAAPVADVDPKVDKVGNYSKGQPVMYKGKQRTILGFKNGQAVLAPE